MSHTWKATEIPVLALAFIGDAVWHVYVRDHVLDLGYRRPQDLHRAATRYARAEGEAHAAAVLLAELTPEEQGILRRGRNAKSHRAAKHADILDYRHGTGFETLLGYLHGEGDMDRLDYVCRRALSILDEEGDNEYAAKQAKGHNGDHTGANGSNT